MSDSVRAAFSKLRPLKYHPEDDLPVCSAYEVFNAGYQAATAAADDEWRGVVEKLVEALENCRPYQICTELEDIIRPALAQAEQLMGRK